MSLKKAKNVGKAESEVVTCSQPMSKVQDWTVNMTPSARQHALITLKNTAGYVRPGGQEDCWGFKRGSCRKDGIEVCAKFEAADLSKLTDETLATAYHCAACGISMHDHERVSDLPQTRPHRYTAAHDQDLPDDLPQKQPPMQPQTHAWPSTVDEADSRDLNEFNDPLAINSLRQRKPKPKPSADAASVMTPDSEAADDDAKAFNLSFKMEVERAVREANLREAAQKSDDDAEEARLLRQLDAHYKSRGMKGVPGVV